MSATGLVLASIALLLLASCGVGSTPTPTVTAESLKPGIRQTSQPAPTRSQAPSSVEALGPPVLSEPQAFEASRRQAALSRMRLTAVSNIRNRQARLMKMGEYWASGRYDKGVFGSAMWYPESDLPVWVVLMEGDSEPTLPSSPPRAPVSYSHFVVVLNAHTGEEIGVSPLTAPDQLIEEAQGLDPALYARYPLDAILGYADDVTDFPVTKPGLLPSRFFFAGVTLELAHPLQNVLTYPLEPKQTVVQIYSDGQGSTVQLAQYRGGLPNLVEDADLVTVRDIIGWASPEPGESTWLAWTWLYPDVGAYVTNILYTEARSVSLDTLHEIAESMPGGRAPLPTPNPVTAPTALPKPA